MSNIRVVNFNISNLSSNVSRQNHIITKFKEIKENLKQFDNVYSAISGKVNSKDIYEDLLKNVKKYTNAKKNVKVSFNLDNYTYKIEESNSRNLMRGGGGEEGTGEFVVGYPPEELSETSNTSSKEPATTDVELIPNEPSDTPLDKEDVSEEDEEVVNEKFGTEEVGTEEDGTSQVGTKEVGTEEDGTKEVETEEDGTEQVETDEVGTEEDGTSQVGTKEVGTEEVGTETSIAPPGALSETSITSQGEQSTSLDTSSDALSAPSEAQSDVPSVTSGSPLGEQTTEDSLSEEIRENPPDTSSVVTSPVVTEVVKTPVVTEVVKTPNQNQNRNGIALFNLWNSTGGNIDEYSDTSSEDFNADSDYDSDDSETSYTNNKTYILESDDDDEEFLINNNKDLKNKKYLNSLNVNELRGIMKNNNMKVSNNGSYYRKNDMIKLIQKNV